MTETPDPGPDQPQHDPPLYPVAPGVDDTAVCEGLRLPRRPGHGSLGVLLVDRPNALVYLLDADDTARVFRGRARRPLAGDPTDLGYPRDGTDHIIRAAHEGTYDVIAAEWADAAEPARAEQVTS